MIRRSVLWYLIWVCTVFQLTFNWYPDYNGLKHCPIQITFIYFHYLNITEIFIDKDIKHKIIHTLTYIFVLYRKNIVITVDQVLFAGVLYSLIFPFVGSLQIQNSFTDMAIQVAHYFKC